MEKINVRYLDIEFSGTRDLDFISIDVSFISLKLVFPVASQLLLGRRMAVWCALSNRSLKQAVSQVGKKGIVRDPAVHSEVIENVIAYGIENGLYSHGLTFSPVTGSKGQYRISFIYAQNSRYRTSISEDVDKDTSHRYSHEELDYDQRRYIFTGGMKLESSKQSDCRCSIHRSGRFNVYAIEAESKWQESLPPEHRPA